MSVPVQRAPIYDGYYKCEIRMSPALASKYMQMFVPDRIMSSLSESKKQADTESLDAHHTSCTKFRNEGSSPKEQPSKLLGCDGGRMAMQLIISNT